MPEALSTLRYQLSQSGRTSALGADRANRLCLETHSERYVLIAPRQAIFFKDGKRIVYVKEGNGLRRARGEDPRGERKAGLPIEGLDAGTTRWP